MTRLSVNINKVALLRNARGGNLPDLIRFAIDCEKAGAQGITVHPREDERHIRYSDIPELKPRLTTEFNIEGYPSRKWLDLVIASLPDQATLVPDKPEALTSNQGWDTIKNSDFLRDVISELHAHDIRVAVFVDPIEQFVEGAHKEGADRVEFYTGPYAELFPHNREKALEPYRPVMEYARKIGLGVNAGHDLNLQNLAFLKRNIPFIDEVSIGHALISDALYFGIENTIQMYLRQLEEI